MNRHVARIEVEVNGVLVSGFYAVQSSMLTVWHAFPGSRTRTISGDPEIADVQRMLLDLYAASEARLSQLTRAQP